MPRLTVVNPATLEPVGEVEAASPEEVPKAVERARLAARAWAGRPLAERLGILANLQRRVLQTRDELADIVHREEGKPRAEALVADVLVALDALRFVVREGPGILEPKGYRLGNPVVFDRRSRIVREPLGVVGIVSPFNYPLGIPASQAAFALAAGNAVLVKPAPETPLALLRFRELAVAAGVPEDVFQVLVGGGAEVGAALVDADLDHVIFTGSTDVGLAIGERCRTKGRGCTLELGGNDAALVLDDADVGTAAAGLTWARFTNAGQTCAAPKRILVHRAVLDAFLNDVVARTRALAVGVDGDVGPLIRGKAVEEMEAFVHDAVEGGARVLAGGEPVHDLPGYFYQPTILVDVPPDARVRREEAFGPILVVIPFDHDDDAVAIANDSAYGLTASVWTRDRERGRRLARRLDAGTVTINDHLYTYGAADTPWGGVKDSGQGHTHGTEGLVALTRAKHVNEAPATRAWPVLWWFPYGDQQFRRVSDGLRFVYGETRDRLTKAPAALRAVLGKARR